jgi:hypothetical protein
VPGIGFDIFAKDKGASAAFEKIAKNVDATKSAMERVAKANDEASRSSARLRQTQAAEADAIGKVRVATAKLEEIRRNTKAKTSQITAAEEALATAQRKAAQAADANAAAVKRAAGAQESAKGAAKQLADAQASAFDKVAQKAKGSASQFEQAGKTAGSKFSNGLKETADGAKQGKLFAGRFGLGLNGAVGGIVSRSGGVIAAGLAAVSFVSLFKSFINEARESRRVGALTEQVIKSTGGAAKVSAKQVGDLATAISNKTGADDEAIQSGSNLLLTFTNIKNGVGKSNQIFDQATTAVTDMAAAMNDGQVTQDGVKTASIQLGKALNDPIKGITALSKVGVSFTGQQKKQIETLVKSGDVMGAQKVILKELGKEFGGAATAATDPLTKLSTISGNLKEQIGTALLPIVDKAATWLGTNLPKAVDAASTFFSTKLAPAASAIWSVFKDKVLPIGGQVVDMFKGLGSKLKDAIGPIDFKGIADNMWTDASTWAGRLISGWKDGIEKGDWKPLGKAIGEGLTNAVQNIGEGTGKLLDAIGALIDKVDWSKLGSKVSNGFLSLVHSIDWDNLGGAIGDAFITALQKTKDLSVKLTDAIKAFIVAVDWQKVGHDSTDAIGRFASGVDWVKLGKVTAQFMATGLKVNLWDIPNLISGTLADVALGIWDSLNAAMTKAQFSLHDVGANLISGLWSGIKDALSGAEKWLEKNLVEPIHNWVRNLFGIHSPSTMFAAIGGELIAGLKVGIVAGVSGIGKWISKTIIAPIVGGFATAGTWLVQHGKNMVAGFKNGVAAIAKGIGGWMYSTVIQPAVARFGTAGTWLVQHGKNAIAGFKNGIAAVAKGIGRWVYGTVISPLAVPFGAAGSWLVQAGRNAIAGLKNGIVAVASGIGRWIYGQAISPLVAPFGKAGSWLVQAGKNVIAGFKNGMVNIWGSVTKWVSGIATWIKDHKGPVSLDGRLLIPAGKAIMNGFLSGLKSGAGPAWSFVKSVGGKTVDMLRAALGGIGGAIGSGGSVPNATGMAKLVQSIANSFAGWGSGYQWDALYKLIMGESGFRSNAQNPSSTAYGLFQFLDSTWGSVGAHKTSDPTQQTIAGLKYIQQSYGSPAQAYAAWSSRSPHWYEKGTPWVPDDQLAYLHKGEAVIPAAENKKRLASSSGLMDRITGKLHRLHEQHLAHIAHLNHVGRAGRPALPPVNRMPKMTGAKSQQFELVVNSGGSAMDEFLAQMIRKYVKVVAGGDVQQAFGASR